jgi:predicted secreted protein
LGLCIILLGSSCFQGPHNVTVTVEYQTFQQRPNFTKDIDILLGAELKLVLHSNGTTGSSWTDPAQLSDPMVLEQTDHDYVIRPNPREGEAGHEVFIFETRSKGTCLVYLEYKRPFSAEVTYSCTINVEVM